MEFLFDWQTLMAAVAHWLAGGDPYGPYRHLQGQMMHAGAFAYPPPSLLLGAPLALLPWRVSGILMLLLSIASFEHWIRRTSGRIGLPWLLLWLPLCQGIWIGQTTLLSLAGLALAELAYRDGHDRRGGLLLALALLKPQTVALPAAWLLLVALRERRWWFLAAFGALTAALWGGVALISGPHIYALWLEGLRAYGPELPNRPLLFPPLGPLFGLLAGLLWWRYGRGDVFGLALLVNTLVYPLSVVYVAVGVAFVVVRWRPAWPWYPLGLSWVVAATLPMPQRTPDTIATMTQAIVMTGLFTGFLPPIPWARMLRQSVGQP